MSKLPATLTIRDNYGDKLTIKRGSCSGAYHVQITELNDHSSESTLVILSPAQAKRLVQFVLDHERAKEESNATTQVSDSVTDTQAVPKIEDSRDQQASTQSAQRANKRTVYKARQPVSIAS